MQLSCSAPDLTPPPFAEGLCDWSSGDGTPDSPTYESDETARIARGDVDFGDCLELRKTAPVQRLRYMGELPIRRGAQVEIVVRIKALRGPLPGVRIAAWPGGFGGRALPDLPQEAHVVRLFAHEAVAVLRAVVGREAGADVTLAWDERALYAHVGLDLVGPSGGVVRVANIEAREIAAGLAPPLPGFTAEDAAGPLAGA